MASLAPEADGQTWPRAATAWYSVAILLLAYTVSYVDRSILTVLVEPIQADLKINDTQIGLLHGFAFVIFYVTLGIPLGYVADRGNRKWLIVTSISLWSMMTAFCGITRTFGDLFIARIGVGVGEAGLSPATYSLISDYFPPQKRTTALGVYNIGIFLGSGIAILTGGLIVAFIADKPIMILPLIGAIKSWHLVFFAVGLPGLLVALIALTIKEPTRRMQNSVAVFVSNARWRDIGIHIRAHLKVYGLITTGFAFLGVPFNVAVLWARPYISRHFAVAPGSAAILVGLIMMIAATAGIVIGSIAADRLLAKGRTDATVRIGIFAALAVVAPIVLFPLLPTLNGALCALAVILFFGAFAFGAAPASIQLITPNRMRATISGLYLVLVNLVGLATGPVVTGMLTDYVFRDPRAVGASAAIVGGASALIAAFAFSMLLAPFRKAASAHAASQQVN